MEAKSVACRSIVAVRRKDSVKTVSAKMRAKGASCAVVVENRFPVGILSDTELLELLDSDSDLSAITVESVMRTPVVSVRENQELFTAIRRSGGRDFWLFPVVDAEGRVKGLITEKEIIHKYALLAFPHNMTLATLKKQGLTATPDAPVKKLTKMMLRSRQSCVTILKGRRPAGVINRRTAAKMTPGELKAPVGRKMTKRILSAKSESSVREAVIKMVKMGLTEIVVTNEDGYYYGVVTSNDLVRHVERISL